MPEDEYTMPENKASIWEAIDHWIPDEHLEEYQRFIRNVKGLPGSDPVLHAILAMGIFAVIARQVPGEVAKQLSATEKQNGQSLANAQQQSDRVLKTMQESTARLENLLRINDTRVQVNISTEQALSELEKRLKSYLDPIPSGQLSIFRVEIKAAGNSLVSFTNKCNASIDACDNLLKKIEHGIQAFDHVGKQLQARITRNTTVMEDVIAKIERVSKQHRFIYMALGIIVLSVAFALGWTFCAMHQSALGNR